ncbi:MAG: septal ring lytic transglycosylase RlpA family protein [Gammaproteobacteria bacterium]|nr:MAG: septal ring lytic transglycosylase RlpA family protein [Gammaproteobacteria bacterium]
MKRLYWLTLILALILTLGGCSTRQPGGYYKDDGPHKKVRVNIDAIQDAVPRHEPLSKNGNKPYTVFGKIYFPLKSARGYRARGVASWYGKKFHGNRTSSGETYDMYAMSAAHKTLPLPSYVRVTNLGNRKSVILRVNDRGPFLQNRLIDLSYAAASKLGITATGTGRVEVTAIVSAKTASAYSQYDTAPVVGEKLDDDTKTKAPVKRHVPVVNHTRPEKIRMFLQVGAFSSHDNALSLRDRLEKLDIHPVVIRTIKKSNGQQIFRVRIGPLANSASKDLILQRVTKIGISDAHVVRD